MRGPSATLAHVLVFALSPANLLFASAEYPPGSNIPKNSSVVVKIKPPEQRSVVAKGPAPAPIATTGIPGLGGAPEVSPTGSSSSSSAPAVSLDPRL